VETAGLDVSEHGMWGYPEFYIPVPGGYGTTESTPIVGPLRHAVKEVDTPAVAVDDAAGDAAPVEAAA
jgi:hypothetical protein